MNTAGVVGFGYWGPKLARTLMNAPEFQLQWICDSSPEAGAVGKEQLPGVSWRSSMTQAQIADPVDLICIATPANSHFELAKEALTLGANVLITKPLTLTTRESEHLLTLAQDLNREVFVDLTYLYTPAVIEICRLISSGEIGDLCFINSNRSNLGLVQSDCSVLWDLAVHDLAIVDAVCGGLQPTSISLETGKHPLSNYASRAALGLSLSNDVLVSIFVTWESSVKTRTMIFGGTEGTITFDDTLAKDKVRLTKGRIERYSEPEAAGSRALAYQLSDVTIANLPEREALALEFEQISSCLNGGTPMYDTASIAKRGVAILERAEVLLGA